MNILLVGNSKRSIIWTPVLFLVAICYCLRVIGSGKCRASFKHLKSDALVFWVTADGICWIAMVVGGRHGVGR